LTAIISFENGEEITGFYLMKSAEVKQTSTTPAKDYFDIILSDKTGEIPAKLWDLTATDKETYRSPMLVKVKAAVQSYRDKLQLKVIQIRPAKDDDGVTIMDFVKSAPVAAPMLLQSIYAAVDDIQDVDIRNVVRFCLSKAGSKLIHYPAAKAMHHNFYAGLVYHTSRMLELGEYLCKQRPFLDPDLIKAGIILHDIAKTEEMIAELGAVQDYSFTGRLIGHISLAANWVLEASIELDLGTDNEKIVILQHLILSHHNLGEWGSPVQPQLPEAVAIHYIDQLDAKMQAAEDAVNAAPDTEGWTAPVRILENKQLYLINKGKVVQVWSK